MKTSVLVFTIGLLSMNSCQLTDHSERPDTIESDLINVPISGYENVDPEKLPRFEFQQDRIDVGDISQGTVVKRVFKFENVGGSPLLIADVRSTCGCTVGKNWPTQPIAPGGFGEIEVSFDSEGKSGLQDKPVSIVANTSPETTVVRLIANVLAPKGTNEN